MKLYVRALVAAIAGFAVGYAARDKVQRVHEARKMRQLEQALSGADTFQMGGFPHDPFDTEGE